MAQFSKNSRLLCSKDFKGLREGQKVFRVWPVSFYVKKKETEVQSECRLGLGISKRVGNAVLRNRIKESYSRRVSAFNKA